MGGERRGETQKKRKKKKKNLNIEPINPQEIDLPRDGIVPSSKST